MDNNKIKVKKKDIQELVNKVLDKKKNKELKLDEFINADNTIISGDEPIMAQNQVTAAKNTTDKYLDQTRQRDYATMYGYFLKETLLSNEDYDNLNIEDDEKLSKILSYLKKRDRKTILCFILCLIEGMDLQNSFKIKEKILAKLNPQNNNVFETITEGNAK